MQRFFEAYFSDFFPIILAIIESFIRNQSFFGTIYPLEKSFSDQLHNFQANYLMFRRMKCSMIGRWLQKWKRYLYIFCKIFMIYKRSRIIMKISLGKPTNYFTKFIIHFYCTKLNLKFPRLLSFLDFLTINGCKTEKKEQILVKIFVKSLAW